MKFNLHTLLLLLVIILLSILIYLITKKENNSFSNNSTQTPDETEIVVSSDTKTADIVVTPLPEKETKSLKVYTDSERGFSVEYPDNIKPENMQSGEVTFTVWGPTQAEDTEFYDGILISFQSISFDGLDLKERVEEEREMLADLYGEPLSEIDPITIDGQEGYIYNDHIAQYIYVPQAGQRYLYIVNMTKDPGNMGYKDTVYKMIESIKILE